LTANRRQLDARPAAIDAIAVSAPGKDYPRNPH